MLKDSPQAKLAASPFYSILLDESCDISVSKKLLLFARSITPEFDLETHFIENIYITDGTAKSIYENTKTTLVKHGRRFSLNKVVAIGSDGASVMTGSKNGYVALKMILLMF